MSAVTEQVFASGRRYAGRRGALRARQREGARALDPGVRVLELGERRQRVRRRPDAVEALDPGALDDRVVENVQRAALTYVGATLSARDRVAEIAGTLSDRKQVERRLKAFERRGTTARNRVERELKKQRTRIEREARKRTTRVERDVKNLRGDVRTVYGDVQRFGRDAQRTYAAQSASLFGAVAENAGQGAVLAATKAARQVTGRVAQLV